MDFDVTRDQWVERVAAHLALRTPRMTLEQALEVALSLWPGLGALTPEQAVERHLTAQGSRQEAAAATPTEAKSHRSQSGVKRAFAQTMTSVLKPIAVAAVAAAAALAVPQSAAARVGIGIGIGVPIAGYYGPGYWAPYYGPRYVYHAPPAVLVQAAPLQSPPTAPDPIFYPKNGQSPEQTESDRRECNRWAATQPAALADAGVFQRATYACMEGRGYSVR